MLAEHSHRYYAVLRVCLSAIHASSSSVDDLSISNPVTEDLFIAPRTINPTFFADVVGRTVDPPKGQA